MTNDTDDTPVTLCGHWWCLAHRCSRDNGPSTGDPNDADEPTGADASAD